MPLSLTLRELAIGIACDLKIVGNRVVSLGIRDRKRIRKASRFLELVGAGDGTPPAEQPNDRPIRCQCGSTDLANVGWTWCACCGAVSSGSGSEWLKPEIATRPRRFR